VPAGNELILTQTTANPMPGCVPATGSFDGSDIGPNGTDWTNHCTQSGVIPEVDVTISGALTSLPDTSQVLNTGGVDAAACGTGNESLQWALIGGPKCPGSSLTLAPPTQTHRVGETASLTATFANSCGQGLSGATVGFQVGVGPNIGLTRAGTTDNNGQVTVSYTSSAIGTDRWFAAVHNPAGFIYSNEADVVWTAAITYTGRAYDASAKILNLNPLLVGDTGSITTTGTTDTVQKTADLQGPPLTLSVLRSEVATGGGASAAWAEVASFKLAITGVPTIAATAVNTSSGSTCSGSAGSTSIASLTINGQGINVNNLAPNTTIPLLLPGAKIVLNEQLPVAGADHGLEVNAIHVIVPNIADVVVSSSRSDIHFC
jgi:hypothetical protein